MDPIIIPITIFVLLVIYIFYNLYIPKSETSELKTRLCMDNLHYNMISNNTVKIKYPVYYADILPDYHINKLSMIFDKLKTLNFIDDNNDEIAIIITNDIYIDSYWLCCGIEKIIQNAPIDWQIIELASSNVKLIGDPLNPTYEKYNSDNGKGLNCFIVRREALKSIIMAIKIKNFKTYSIIPPIFGTRGQFEFIKFYNSVLVSRKEKTIYCKCEYTKPFCRYVSEYPLIDNMRKADIFVDSSLNFVKGRKSLTFELKKKYPNKKFILLDNEPFDISHFSFPGLVISTKLESSKYNAKCEKFIYIPYYSVSLAEYKISPTVLISKPPLPVKTKFCAFVYSNSNTNMDGVKNRIDFFNLMQSMCGNRIDSWGKSCNNMKRDNRPWFDPDYRKQISKYKFMITFENNCVDGYITEKIMNPILAGTIPIYLGSKDIGLHFNTNSFIHVRDYQSWEDCINHILYLDNNDDAYNEIYKEYWLKNNKLTKHFAWWDGSLGTFYQDIQGYF